MALRAASLQDCVQHQAGQEGFLERQAGPAGHCGGLWAGDEAPWAQGDSIPQPKGPGTGISPIVQRRECQCKKTPALASVGLGF